MSDFDRVVNLAREVLGVRVTDHALHSSNIANADTPNYLAKISSFEARLRQVQKDINSPELDFRSSDEWDVKMKLAQSKASTNLKGNNVQLDQETAAMSENALNYLSTMKILSKTIAIEKYAITSGNS